MDNTFNILTIAGSDSGGGAGIQADIKTISACGCYATSAITAVTVQNTMGVTAVHPVPADVVKAQIEAVLSDIGATAVKIGMLQSASVVKAVIEALSQYDVPQGIVLDTVMVSTSGHPLLDPEGIRLLQEQLIPMTRVITPNIPEAQILLGETIAHTPDALADAARQLAMRYRTSVLLKGGHLDSDQLMDVLYDNESGIIYELPSSRVNTRNTHGTGCTLSSALASMLARGMSLPRAAQAAKDYINQAIIHATDYEIGHGHGPLNHFWNHS